MMRTTWAGRLTVGLVLALGQGAVASEGSAHSEQARMQVEYLKLNRELDDLAQALARAMRDPAVRRMVKEEASLERTGDTEALIKHLDLKSAGGFTRAVGRGLQEAQAARGNAMATGAATAKVQELNTRIRNLHVAVRTHLRDWDPDTQIPLVAYSPEGIQEEKITEIRAYDVNGKAYALGTAAPPEVPVVVVGVNERTDSEGEVRAGATCEDCEPRPEPENHPTSICSTTSYRTSGDTEVLGTLNVVSDEEYWWDGDAEIMLKIARPNETTPIYHGFFTADWDAETSRRYERNLFNWYPTGTGEFLMYFWYEEDGGYNIPVNVSGTYMGVTAGFNFTIANDDDQMGYTVVGFQDPKRLYDVGRLNWTECWVDR